jgi:WD40 repeat protein
MKDPNWKLDRQDDVAPVEPPRLDRTVTSTEGDPVDVPAQDLTLHPEASRYIIGKELARGGLGRILEAHDARLDRLVALKELLASTDVLRERFHREAGLTARLQHPAIVPVYDSGSRQNGEPFYVMKLLSGGRTLRDLVADATTLDDRLTLLPNCIAVADAMAYAHSLNIIHRDLKPSNVLVGPFGETVVIDWGLAKDLSRPQADALADGVAPSVAADVTSAGSILGTPQYMAPEQARGGAVDKRADVYALGSLLYQVLCGEPPYRGADASDILAQVVAADPIAVERRQPGVPRELATIVRKAMARDPAARYDSAAELAADLKRFQTGQLVSAHEYSAYTLFARRVRKHRGALLVAAVLLALLAATLTLSARRILRERNEARRQSSVAERQRSIAETARNGLILSQARSSLEHDPTATVAWLKAYAARAPGSAAVVHELAVDAAGRGVARHVFRRSDAQTSAAAFSPDGKRFVLAENDGVRIIDLATGKRLMALPNPSAVDRVEYSPDGKLLALINSGSPEIRLWNLDNNTVKDLRGHKADAWAMRFSPDSRRLVSSDIDGEVRLWSLNEDRSTILHAQHDSIVDLFAFSPDGATLATASARNRDVRVWTLSSGHCLERTSEGVTLDFSPDARTLVSTTWDGTLRLWSYATGAVTLLRGHSARVVEASFSPDGKLLASAGFDGTVRLWSLATGRGTTLLDHLGVLYWVEFSPDGKLLATARSDGTVIVSDLKGNHHSLKGHRGEIQELEFAQGGRWLASASGDRATRVWPLQPFPQELLGHRGEISAVTFSGDGKFLVSSGSDRTVRRWNLETGQSELFAKHTATVSRIAVAPDDETIASASRSGVWLWNPRAKTSKALAGAAGAILGLTFSRDGSKIAAAGERGIIDVWSLDGTTHTPLGGHKGQIHSVRFLPDGEHLLSGGQDGTVRLWDLGSPSSRTLSADAGLISRVAISPAGDQFAAATWQGTIRLYDARSLSSRVLKGHEGPVYNVEFSADGAKLISTSTDQTVRVWSIATGKSRVFTGHTDEVQVARFIGNGLIASTGNDGTVRIWRETTGELVWIERPETAHLLTLAFSSKAHALAYAGSDPVIRVLSLDHLLDGQTSDASWLERLTTAQMGDDERLSSPQQ